jgi:hypothetical protein
LPHALVLERGDDEFGAVHEAGSFGTSLRAGSRIPGSSATASAKKQVAAVNIDALSLAARFRLSSQKSCRLIQGADDGPNRCRPDG